MLKIEINEGRGHIEQKGCIRKVMADMFSAIHAFYNTLEEDEKRCFVKSFNDCIDDIFADDGLTDLDINKACDKQEEKKEEEVKYIDELLDTLRELKGILKELSE